MACISKLASAIAYDCDSGATGLIDALIINKSDIASFSVSPELKTISGMTLVPGAKAYKIDTVKRSLVVSSSLKINDGAPNAYAHTANIIHTGFPALAYRDAMAAFTNGPFVILARSAGYVIVRAYGLYYGLSATEINSSSHDNGGWASITLSTPENVIGEDNLLFETAIYETLSAAAVG